MYLSSESKQKEKGERMIGKLMKLNVNGTLFSRGDIVMILTDEEMPLAWHYLSGKALRVSREEVLTITEYYQMLEREKGLEESEEQVEMEEQYEI